MDIGGRAGQFGRLFAKCDILAQPYRTAQPIGRANARPVGALSRFRAAM
jgi:hypothetical protein